jgi:hypothetical protein
MLLHLPAVHVPNFVVTQTFETKIAVGSVLGAVFLVVIGMFL